MDGRREAEDRAGEHAGAPGDFLDGAVADGAVLHAIYGASVTNDVPCQFRSA